TEGVVDGRAGDFGQPGDSPGVDLVGRQMDVLTVEDLGHDAALCGHPPATTAQTFQKVAHAHQPNSRGHCAPNGCDFGTLLDLDNVYCKVESYPRSMVRGLANLTSAAVRTTGRGRFCPSGGF